MWLSVKAHMPSPVSQKRGMFTSYTEQNRTNQQADQGSCSPWGARRKGGSPGERAGLGSGWMASLSCSLCRRGRQAGSWEGVRCCAAGFCNGSCEDSVPSRARGDSPRSPSTHHVTWGTGEGGRSEGPRAETKCKDSSRSPAASTEVSRGCGDSQRVCTLALWGL